MLAQNPVNSDAREYLRQFKDLLGENQVPKPFIIWLHGNALISLFARIGKEPFHRDGAIVHSQLYRFNLDTGRYLKANPRPEVRNGDYLKI